MADWLDKYKRVWIPVILGGFLLINSWFLSREFYWFSLLPVVLVFVYFLFYKPRYIFYLLIFLTPFSMITDFMNLGVSMYFPTEPLIFGTMLLFILKVLLDRDMDPGILRHPVSIAILLNLFWIFVTSFTSTMPLVSFKFFLSRLWFITVFYFMALYIFKNFNELRRFLWIYLIPLVIVAGHTLFEHQQQFFSRNATNFVQLPFFKDHTIYGAILAFFIPVVYGFSLKPKVLELKSWQWLLSVGAMVVLSAALVFSYTRAAWVSVGVALGALVIFLFRIKFRSLVVAFLILVGLFFTFKNDILLYFQENKATSASDLRQHVQSIYNVTTDESNTERLNRWSCAYRMFREKPVFGWGPGTYMFQYAPFQLSYQKTSISTNFGDVGNAHSEYLGPLADSGLLGSVTFLLIVLISLYRGMQLIYKGKTRKIRLMALIIMLGLITYFTHGLMNNFLTSDKASIPFWGFLAILTALDVYYQNNDEATSQQK